jgi:tetratricopeptide (TPR) repeat protein
MQLQIKPFYKNNFPIGGLLVRSSSVAGWLIAVQEMDLSWEDLDIYPIPAHTPQSIWGCLIITPQGIDKLSAGRHELFQVVSPNLFIAERAILYPAISSLEIQKLFTEGRHIYHPDFGLVALGEAFVPDELLVTPQLKTLSVTRPIAAAYIPRQVRSFRLERVSPEEVIKALEEKMFPKRETMKDRPLSIFEKGKLLFYRALFEQSNSKSGSKARIKKTKEWDGIEKLLTRLLKLNNLGERLQEDFEELDRRNQSEVDKLLDLLKNNPAEALKYAIPLNSTGGARGRYNGQLSLLKRWQELSWASMGNQGPSSGAVNLNDRYFDLQKQYLATAELLTNQEKYHDAAFIYMKLLNSPEQAAAVLEKGRYYHDAASIYIKHTGNKRKAAECYEKGKMTLEAIEIYKDLHEDEKVGDLYLTISRKKEADTYYIKVADNYTQKNQFVKASLIYKQKMGSIALAQEVLQLGWQKGRDAANCLSCYFSNIPDVEELRKQIDHIYTNDIGPDNGEQFLYAIKPIYTKRPELSVGIREIAYEIIAANVRTKPHIVSELKSFNPTDNVLMKDTLRYKFQQKK